MDKFLPVSVIIVSYNTLELLRLALQTLLAGQFVPAQIIVVDNNSQDGSVELVKNSFPEVILIENKENLGFARANNQAIKEFADQPYIWLLNSDTEVGSKTLKQLYDYAESNQMVGGLVPQLVYPDGPWQSVGGFFPSACNVFLWFFPLDIFLPITWRKKLKLIAATPQKINDQGLDLDYGTGAALFLKKDVLDRVGLLSEDYFMYFEETDLCWRLKNAGWIIKAIKTEPVKHVHGGSFKAKRGAKRLEYFVDSLALFVKKNYKGFKRNLILVEIFLFKKISLFIKKV